MPITTRMATASASLDSIQPTCGKSITKTTPLLLCSTPLTSSGPYCPLATVNFDTPTHGGVQNTCFFFFFFPLIFLTPPKTPYIFTFLIPTNKVASQLEDRLSCLSFIFYLSSIGDKFLDIVHIIYSIVWIFISILNRRQFALCVHIS